ncbi:MAG: hypothetical protein WC613_01430 [Candidatus Aenigmatarchaeota archaeon]
MKKPESVRLSKGWNSGLRKIDDEIRETQSAIGVLARQMKQETERLVKEYHRKMPYQRLRKLETLRERALQTIRQTYPIDHPAHRQRFKTYQEAAGVLAHYWQGMPLQRDQLVDRISTDVQFVNRAYDFAKILTEPNSPERNYVDAANSFLWEDAGK